MFKVGLMCSTLGVSRSGYYRWRKGEISSRAQENIELTEVIKAIHKKSRKTYGSPRIHRELMNRGIRCSKNRAARLMRRSGVRAKMSRHFKVTTRRDDTHQAAPNLLQQNFYVDRPNAVWVADITYIHTLEGFLYLATVMDLCSRKIVGWAMASHMKTSLVLAALRMAVRTRRPKAGLIHHSDRGSVYTSKAYQDELTKYGMKCSMSAKGDCYDNAVQESFYHTLKTECVNHERFMTRAEARSVIFDFIEVFYNRERMHSTLGYLSPEDFEQAKLAA